jgi:hypothetical protein
MIGTVGCTNAQVAEWVKWYEQDPVAAVEFANLPEIQASLNSRAPSQNNTNSSRWDRIAQCESGGRWDYPLVTNRTGTYSGGLMIWNKAWDSYGGNEFASDAYLATKAQQIIVAERILADQGWDAWDCA